LKTKITWVAAVVSILVWGRILYNFFYSDIQQLGETQTQSNHAPYKIRKVNKDYELILNYADPFLKTSRKESGVTNLPEKSPKNIKNQKVAITKSTKSPQDQKPGVNFMGTLKNHETGELLALIAIENKEHIMSVGEIINGIQLKGIRGDSVEVI